MSRLCERKPLVVVVAVLAGVVVCYASVLLMGYGLVDLISKDSGWFLILYVGMRLLPVIFAMLTALWIAHLARTRASKDGDDQGRCKPSLVALAVLAGVGVYFTSHILMDWGLPGVTPKDRAWFRIVYFGVGKVLPVIFAMLTALWITHMARTRASRNREDQGEGSPPH